MDLLKEYKNDLLLYFKGIPEYESLDFPTTLFKYCNFKETNEIKYHLDNVRSDLVWLNPANQFNDPYDCAYCVDKDVLKKLTPNFIEHEKEKFQKGIKIASFSSAAPETSLLMWGHYADCHQGFCIGYNLINIINEIDNSNWIMDDRPLLYPVLYRNKLFNITNQIKSPQKNFKSIIISTIKYMQWNYEQEWRLVAIGETDNLGKLFPMPTPSVIYLGTKISPENKKEIVKITNEKQIPVYQMIFSDTDEYKLHPKLIPTKEIKRIITGKL